MEKETIDLEAAQRYERQEIRYIEDYIDECGMVLEHEESNYDKQEYEKKYQYDLEHSKSKEELFQRNRLAYLRSLDISKIIKYKIESVDSICDDTFYKKYECECAEHKKYMQFILQEKFNHELIEKDKYEKLGINLVAAQRYEKQLCNDSIDGQCYEQFETKDTYDKKEYYKKIEVDNTWNIL